MELLGMAVRFLPCCSACFPFRLFTIASGWACVSSCQYGTGQRLDNLTVTTTNVTSCPSLHNLFVSVQVSCSSAFSHLAYLDICPYSAKVEEILMIRAHCFRCLVGSGGPVPTRLVGRIVWLCTSPHCFLQRGFTPYI